VSEASMMLTNEQLVEQFQSGEESAFSLIVERFLPMLRHEVSSILCNHADHDDLAQEALLGLLSAVKRFSPDRGAQFATYARVCIRNRLLNAGKSFSSPELPHEDDWLFERLDGDGALDPNDWLQNKEESVALFKRLKERLSELEYRVLMYHLAAYSYEEIGTELDISAKSVDNALQRVRRKLAQTI